MRNKLVHTHIKIYIHNWDNYVTFLEYWLSLCYQYGGWCRGK